MSACWNQIPIYMDIVKHVIRRSTSVGKFDSFIFEINKIFILTMPMIDCVITLWINFIVGFCIRIFSDFYLKPLSGCFSVLTINKNSN